MLFALLGNHPDGLEMACALVESGRHQLLAYSGPPVAEEYLRRWGPAVKRVGDLEEILADPAVEAVVVAGRPATRPAQLRRESAADPVQDVGLRRPAELELVDRVDAVVLRDRRHRPPQRLQRDARVVHEGGEGGRQRRGQDAADVAHEGPVAPRRGDRRPAAQPARSRTAPRPPPAARWRRRMPGSGTR